MSVSNTDNNNEAITRTANGKDSPQPAPNDGKEDLTNPKDKPKRKK